MGESDKNETLAETVLNRIVNDHLDEANYSRQALEMQNEVSNAKRQLSELLLTIRTILEDDRQSAETLKDVISKQTELIIKINELSLKIENIKERLNEYVKSCDKRIIKLINTIFNNKTKINKLFESSLKSNLKLRDANQKVLINLSLTDRIMLLESEFRKSEKEKIKLKRSVNELIKKHNVLVGNHNKLTQIVKNRKKNYLIRILRYIKLPFKEIWDAIIKSFLIKILISILIGMGLFSQFEEFIILVLDDLY